MFITSKHFGFSFNLKHWYKTQFNTGNWQVGRKSSSMRKQNSEWADSVDRILEENACNSSNKNAVKEGSLRKDGY